MSTEESRHLALPKLYGAPAYARPPSPVEGTERPFDPDNLPLMLAVTDLEHIPMDPEGERMPDGSSRPEPNLTSRPFSLHALSERIRGFRR